MRHEPRPFCCKLTTVSVNCLKAASNDSIETEKKKKQKKYTVRALHFGQVFHNSSAYITVLVEFETRRR